MAEISSSQLFVGSSFECSVEFENSENVKPANNVSNNNDNYLEMEKAGMEIMMQSPEQGINGQSDNDPSCLDSGSTFLRWQCGLCLKVELDQSRYQCAEPPE